MKELKFVLSLLGGMVLAKLFAEILVKSIYYILSGSFLHFIASLVWLAVIVFIEVRILRVLKKEW